MVKYRRDTVQEYNLISNRVRLDYRFHDLLN